MYGGAFHHRCGVLDDEVEGSEEEGGDLDEGNGDDDGEEGS